MAVAVVALAALGGGCGGGGEAASSLTKAEFIKQANQICAERRKKWEGALASYSTEVNKNNANIDAKRQERLAEVALRESILPALEEELEALEGLGYPKKGEQQVEKMLGSLSRGVEKIERQGAKGVGPGLQGFEVEAQEFGLKC
jgi:Holliday junction resolvasome RuvABC DNA-binding subunit